MGFNPIRSVYLSALVLSVFRVFSFVSHTCLKRREKDCLSFSFSLLSSNITTYGNNSLNVVIINKKRKT